jgi:hypothetical protein
VPKPRIEIIFRKGKPTSAFFHILEEKSGKSRRQIAIRPTLVAHYDDAGHPSGLEVPLPLAVAVWQINDALRELGSPPVDDSDLAPLRSL